MAQGLWTLGGGDKKEKASCIAKRWKMKNIDH